jgi:hypothetical protein
MRGERRPDNEPRAVPVHGVQSGILIRRFDASQHSEYVKTFTADRDLDVQRDTVFVAELAGKPVGILALRLMPICHTFEVENSLIARKVAEQLIQYSQGYLAASNFTEAMFFCDTPRAERFVEEQGAVHEAKVDVYTMPIR